LGQLNTANPARRFQTTPFSWRLLGGVPACVGNASGPWRAVRRVMKQEVPLPTLKPLSEENRNERLSALEQTPRSYSLRSQVATTIKLFVIGGSVFALLWMLDRYVTQ
jgi:hypothetical protein